MDSRLVYFEQLAEKFLEIKDPGIMKKKLGLPVKLERGSFDMVVFKKEKQELKKIFQFPGDGFPGKKLISMDYKGYFMIDNNLYHGVIRQADGLVVLVCNRITQEFLDEISTISEFMIKYRNPYSDEFKMVNEIATDPDIMDEKNPLLPYFFDYQFVDFNNLENNKPVEETSRFLLKVDFQNLYSKILSYTPGSTQNDTFRFLILLIVLFTPVIILSLIIGFRMIRVITRSINQITKGTQKIRNGDFSFRIKTRSKDELQYLGESFNEMAAGIDRLLVEEKKKHRLEEELRIARSIQLRLLPPDIFESEEFELAAVNIPAAEIAGDYFDYFYEKDKSLSLLVADVSGKGAPAAFYMAELKGLVNHLHKVEVSPASLLAECQVSLGNTLDKMTFITMIIARFIIPLKKFILARAGHTQAIFYNSRKECCEEIFPEGIAIGLRNFSKEKIKEVEIEYHPGDILLLFSDGLSEIMNQDEEMIGIDNLKRIIEENRSKTAEEIKQELLDFAVKFSETEINRDDLTFIVLKIKA